MSSIDDIASLYALLRLIFSMSASIRHFVGYGKRYHKKSDGCWGLASKICFSRLVLGLPITNNTVVGLITIESRSCLMSNQRPIAWVTATVTDFNETQRGPKGYLKQSAGVALATMASLRRLL